VLFTGKYGNKEDGTYVCAACGQELSLGRGSIPQGYRASTAVDKDKVELRNDDSYGMHRVEVVRAAAGISASF
jgi:peptide-methionine (R)-S-oxide reductase